MGTAVTAVPINTRSLAVAASATRADGPKEVVVRAKHLVAHRSQSFFIPLCARTRRGGATRNRPSRYVPWARDRATGNRATDQKKDEVIILIRRDRWDTISQ
jgi:hypothetical protein